MKLVYPLTSVFSLCKRSKTIENGFLFSLFTMFFICTIANRCEAQFLTSKPVLTIDMAQYGFLLSKGNERKLIFGDIAPHLMMFSKDLAVLYKAQPNDETTGDGVGTMTAFIIDVNTGVLIRKQVWQTRARKSVVETKESEARIVAISGDRYAAMANATLYFYDAAGSLLFSRGLAEGMWSMQPTKGGEELLLRHERTVDGLSQDVNYSWMDAGKWQFRANFKDSDHDRSQAGMLGVDDGLISTEADGLHMLSPDGRDLVICTSPFCKESVLSDEAGTSDGVAIASRFGAGVVALDGKGPIWFREAKPNAGTNRVTVGPIVSSLGGKYLAFYISRNQRHQEFDGEELTLSSEFFVYNAQDAERVAVFPGTGAICSIAPDGSKLISFDGRHLNVYRINK